MQVTLNPKNEAGEVPGSRAHKLALFVLYGAVLYIYGHRKAHLRKEASSWLQPRAQPRDGRSKKEVSRFPRQNNRDAPVIELESER